MRFSIHVDAGYLYAALATRETGSSYRGGIQVDEKALIAELVAMAAADCKADPLRLLWYDAAKDSRPEPDQRRIGLLDGVRLRLGRINAFGEQKGVDLRLGLDMVSLGVNRAVQVAYLLSGDDDLTEAVIEAQDLGLQVKLISVPSANNLGRQAVAEHLLLAVDGALTITPETIARTVTRRITPPPSAPTPEKVPVVPQASPPVPAPETPAAPAKPAPGAPAAGGVVKPTVIPRPPAPRPAPPVQPPAPVKPAVAVSAPPAPTHTAPSYSTPAYSTSTGSTGGGGLGEPVLLDPEMIEQVAQSVYGVWAASAAAEQLHALRAGRPNVPQELDRILLIDLVNRSGISDIPTWARHSLRENFWRAVDHS